MARWRLYLGNQGGGAPPDPDPVLGPTRVTPQQDVRGWQEVAGYALLFSSALMPNANTVAAAEYQVGTHQAAIAASQDRSWVRGTPFTLIPSASGDVILRPTKVAAPEQVDGAYALTFSAPLTYVARVVPPPSTLQAAPEQIDGAYALHWSPPLSYLSRVSQTATTLHAGEQTDGAPLLPSSWVHGTPDTLFPPVPATVRPRTLVTLPQHPDGAYALTFGTQPADVVVGGDVRIAGTVVTYLQPDAERPSWVRLISESLIPPPAPPATGGGPFGWVEYRKERKDDKPEPEAEAPKPERVAPKPVAEPQKAPEPVKPKRKPVASGGKLTPQAPDLSGLAAAFGDLQGFPDFLAEIARRKAQETAQAEAEAAALAEAAARLEALLAAEAFERKKRAAALAIILTLAAA